MTYAIHQRYSAIRFTNTGKYQKGMWEEGEGERKEEEGKAGMQEGKERLSKRVLESDDSQ